MTHDDCPGYLDFDPHPDFEADWDYYRDAERNK